MSDIYDKFITKKLKKDLEYLENSLSENSKCTSYADDAKEFTETSLKQMDDEYKEYIHRLIGIDNCMTLLFLGYLVAKKTGKLKLFGIHWSILNYVCEQQPFIIFCHLKEFTFNGKYSGEEIMGWLQYHLDDNFANFKEAFVNMPKHTESVLYADCFFYSLLLDLTDHTHNYIIPLFKVMAEFYYGIILAADMVDKNEPDLYVGRAAFFSRFDFLETEPVEDLEFCLKNRKEVRVVSDGKVYQFICKHEKVLPKKHSACISNVAQEIISIINNALHSRALEENIEIYLEGGEDQSAILARAHILTVAYIQTNNFVTETLNLINQHFLQAHGYSHYTGRGWKYAEFDDTSVLFSQITGIKVRYVFSSLNLSPRIQHPPCPYMIPETDGTVLNLFTRKREISSPAIVQITRAKVITPHKPDNKLQLSTICNLYKFHHCRKYLSSLQVILYHPLTDQESGSYSVCEHFFPVVEFHVPINSPPNTTNDYLPTPITTSILKSVVKQMDDPEILHRIIDVFPQVSKALIHIFQTGVSSFDFLEELFSCNNAIFDNFTFSVSNNNIGTELNFLDSIYRMSIFDTVEEHAEVADESSVFWPTVIPRSYSWNSRAPKINLDKFHCLQALRFSLIDTDTTKYDWSLVPIEILQDIVIIIVCLCRKNPKSDWYTDDLKRYFTKNNSLLKDLVPWEMAISFKSTDKKINVFAKKKRDLDYCPDTIHAIELIWQFASYDPELFIFLLKWFVSIGCLGNVEKIFLLILGSSNCGKSKLVEHLYSVYNSGTPNVISNSTLLDNSSELNSSALPTTTNFFVNIDEIKKADAVILNKLVSDTPQSFRIMKSQKFLTIQPMAKFLLTTNRIPHLTTNEGTRTRMRCLRMKHSYRPVLPSGTWQYERISAPSANSEYALQLGTNSFPIGINEKFCQEGLALLLEGIALNLIVKNPLSPIKLEFCERIKKDTNYVFSSMDPYSKYMSRTKLFSGKIKPTKTMIENDVHEIDKIYKYHWDQEVIQSIIEACINDVLCRF